MPAALMLELEEAAMLLKCEPSRIEEMLRDGTLAGIKAGRSWALPRDAFVHRLTELALEQAAQRRKPPVSRSPMPSRRRVRPVLSDG